MSGYDTAITTFSPKGELLQVEYAMEAVKMGNMTLGLKTKDHVILAVEKKCMKKLQLPDSIKKVPITRFTIWMIDWLPPLLG